MNKTEQNKLIELEKEHLLMWYNKDDENFHKVAVNTHENINYLMPLKSFVIPQILLDNIEKDTVWVYKQVKW